MSGTSITPPLFPPSGIVRNYGVNFFIYILPNYPAQMGASTTAMSPATPWSFIVSPSVGLMNYFDYLLGPASPFVQATWDDCINDAFLGDNQGSGGAIMFPS